MNFKSKKKIKISDILLHLIVYFASIVTFFALIYIISYIFCKGLKKINWEFISNSYSEGASNKKGILPMILNTIYIVIITSLISFPFGLGTAIYTTQYSKSSLFNKIISFSSDILSGIPSIIFGIFGYSIFCVKSGFGTSILSGCLTMAICILPTIIRTSEEALRKVPSNYKEAAVSLGTKNLRILFTITLPTAFPEICSAISLYVGKILGESAIFIYTTGMAYMLPKGVFQHIFSSGRTLTLHLYQIAKQATTEDSMELTFATSSVLIIMIFIINFSIDMIVSKIKNK